MKKLISLLLSISLCLAIFPNATFAIEKDDKELEEFLQVIGWSKQDYLNYLKEKDYTLDDFYSVDELGTPLSEEFIQQLLKNYDLTREELNDLLIENGDIEENQDVLNGEYLIFNEDLDYYVDAYLNEFVGTPIDEDTLKELLTKYDFTSIHELEEFLNQYDDSLEYYEYVEDLGYMLDYYINGDEFEEEMYHLFSEIGLTDEELDNLFAYLEELDWKDPTFSDRLLALSERMVAFEEFDSAEDLTAKQMVELLSIFSEIVDTLKININYYLMKDGQKEPISFQSLSTLESVNGSDFLLEIYTNDGQFLADILLTAEMFGSDIIKETGRDIKEAEKTRKEISITKKAPSSQTVKGVKLPTTASNYLQNVIIGIVILGLGLILLQRSRKKLN